MLQTDGFEIDGEMVCFFPDVRGSDGLPVALQFWAAYVARDLLQLGVLFRAAAIMLQVPGAGRYEVELYDDANDELGDQDEDPQCWVGGAERDTVFTVLAECLRRLGAADLMEQVPGAADYEREELSAKWKKYLGRRAETKHGLLNVVAECLDELIVRPGMAEIDAEPRPSWWQKWWSKM